MGVLAAPQRPNPLPAGAAELVEYLRWVRLLALVLGLALLLGGIAVAGLVAVSWSICPSPAGPAGCPGAPGAILVLAVLTGVFGLVDLLTSVETRRITAHVVHQRYSQARGLALTWGILGVLVGGVIVGALVLLAGIRLTPWANRERGLPMSGTTRSWLGIGRAGPVRPLGPPAGALLTRAGGTRNVCPSCGATRTSSARTCEACGKPLPDTPGSNT